MTHLLNPIFKTLRVSFFCITTLFLVSACESSSDSGSDSENNDTDTDLVQNDGDNCPSIPNTDQLDTDGDGIGDACDATSDTVSITDTDEDGVSDSQDNCPLAANADQIDIDANGVGDACDMANNADADGDGVPDDSDNCPAAANPDQIDTDADDVGDACDSVNNAPTPVDTDNDGLTDDVELDIGTDPANPDTDADGALDGVDKFPNDPTASLDSDDDGVSDDRDQFPNDSTETSDLNGDGLGDNANPFEGTIISGDILDSSTDAPIAAAQVSLELVNTNNETNPVVLTETNAQGRFTLVAEESLIPDSFVVVVTAEDYRPAALPLANNDTEIDALVIKLIATSDAFVVIEPIPSVHHLGDDSFGGVINSQFQRNSEGPSLTRSFNLSSSQIEKNVLTLSWVAKGIQRPNTISINGTTVATTENTDAGGSFTAQDIELEVSGVLLQGANTLTIESVATNTANDIDDFEFVLIGFSGL